MSARRALLATVLVVIVGAAIALLVGSNDHRGSRNTGGTRAIALDVDSGGRAFALVERLDAGRWRPAVARARDDGSLDQSFADVPLDDVAAIVAESDGALLVAGDRTVGGRRRMAVARITAGGRPDPAFGTNGVVTVAAGDGDAVARGLASGAANGIVVVGDTTDGDRHALAVARIDPGGGRARTELIDDATAGGAAADRDGEVIVAGTDTRDGGAVLARVQDDGRSRVTRAPTRLTSATWRAVAATADGGAVVVGSGRDATGRSLVAVQRFGSRDEVTATASVAVGAGDAYGVAVQVDGADRVVVGVDGVHGDRPAAFAGPLSLPGREARTPLRRRAGRVAGVTRGSGVLTTEWVGERQGVSFNP